LADLGASFLQQTRGDYTVCFSTTYLFPTAVHLFKDLSTWNPTLRTITLCTFTHIAGVEACRDEPTYVSLDSLLFVLAEYWVREAVCDWRL